ncbi:MAG: protein kinase domain-containing protein, partial [Candidatus Xenobia bacterium]
MPTTAELIADRYQVQEELLACRFSTLYKAVDHHTGAPCVLRHLHTVKELAEMGERARYQFTREGRVLRKLVHRNLPRVLDALEHNGEFYLLLEPFEGRT